MEFFECWTMINDMEDDVFMSEEYINKYMNKIIF